MKGKRQQATVTPLAGVWIEIDLDRMERLFRVVTPLAGVWIEIVVVLRKHHNKLSLPSRECGLK